MNRIKLLYITLLALAVCFAVIPIVSAEDEEPDSRLDTKVTLSLGSVTLEQLASVISKETGVTILIGNSKSDWQAKERKTIVYVKDVTVRSLLQRITELHHYRMSRSGKVGQWIYTIRQDKRASDEEKALREEDELAPYRGAEESLDYMAELSGKTSTMSKSQLDDLAEKDPYKHFLLTDPLGQAMCELASKMPSGIINGPGSKTIPLDQADPGLRDAAARFVVEMKKFEMMIAKSQGEGTEAMEQELQQMPVPARIVIDDMSQRQGSEEYAMGLLGEMDIKSDTTLGDFPFIKPGGAFAGMVGKAIGRMRAGGDPNGIEKEFEEAAKKTAAAVSIKDEPLLSKKIKIKKDSDYPLTLKAVHETTGLPILGDSYREMWSFPAAEYTIKDLCMQASSEYQKDISKEGTWLIVKDKLWYKRRAADIPEAYLKALQAKIKEQDFGLSEFQKIAMDLSDEQIDDNLLRDPRFSVLDSMHPKEPREALRFFGSLSSKQIKMMTGESRLPVEDLPVEALKHALAALHLDMEWTQGKMAVFANYKPLTDEQGRRIGAKFYIQYQKPDGQMETLTYSLHTFAPRLVEKESEQ